MLRLRLRHRVSPAASDATPAGGVVGAGLSGTVGFTGWVLVLALALLVGCSGSDSESRRLEKKADTEALELRREYWFDGMSPISVRGDRTYQFRRNNVSFLAWAHALEKTSRSRRRVLVHLDAHSDAHPAPIAEDPDAVRSMDWQATLRYTAALPISAFIMPALHYGWIDEVYWIQPPTSGFRGPEETVRFDLEEVAGRIVPKSSPGVRSPNAREERDSDEYWMKESEKLLRGVPVSRSFELGYAYRRPVSTWKGDSFAFHFTSLEQFQDRLDAGELEDCELIIDLDLDYFGSAGPLRAYGLLTPTPAADVAAGVKGALVPFFRLDPATSTQSLAKVRSWIDTTRPLVVTVSESPDHSLRDRLPELSREVAVGSPGPASSAPKLVRIWGSTGSDSADDSGADSEVGTLLEPLCPTWVDLGDRDSLVVLAEWSAAPAESLEISVYFDPEGARDILAARWWVDGGKTRTRFAVPLPMGSDSRFLDNGWDLEVRRQSDGLLLWTAAFALDRNGARRERFERGLSATELATLSTSLDVVPLSSWVEWAEQRSWPASRVHDLLRVHPETYDAQCESLQRLH